ncbi:hypothetical protein DFS34DRAFT_105323 [Phlyctochytrium arcticum]|nr:hypothetical protein DFS34DRAFT_105323 [Phlyctochytrium arcticum]
MYKLMSEHIGAKIDKLALTEKTKMGARPPPIMTKHPPPPSKRLIQSRARNEQKRSRSVPPQTPALGGYKFPSLKRRDNESVQWSDEESSEFSGSESEVSDTSSASTAFRNRRQKATKFNQRKGSRRSSQSPSRSSPASATTPASDWLLRSMSVPPSPGGTLREKFRKFTDAITFKRNKTADATLWLQQQQREAMERRRSSAAGSDTQSPRRNKRLPKPPTQDQIQEQTEEESSETESEEEEEESERGRRQVDYTSPTRHIAPASTRTSNAYLGHSNWRNRATNIAAAGGRDSGPASALSPQRHQQPVSGWADSAPKSADYIPALAGRSVMFSPVDDRSTEPPHRRTSNFRVPQDDTTSLSDEEEETSDQDTSDMGPATRAPAKVPTTTKNISPIREESEMDTNTTSELNKTTNHTTSSSNRSTSHPSTTNTSTSRPPKTPTSHSQPPPRKDPSTDSFIVSSPDSSMSSMPPPKQTPVTSKEHRTPVSKTKENDNYSDITSIDSFMETV